MYQSKIKAAVFIVGVYMHAACKSFIVNQEKSMKKGTLNYNSEHDRAVAEKLHVGQNNELT